MVSNLNYCSVCGKVVDEWLSANIISNQLAQSWQLTPIQIKQFNRRESSFCPFCNNSLRTRALASAITAAFSYPKSHFLTHWIKKANKDRLRVAEINSCGRLHPFLKKLRYLSYSEYNPNSSQLSFFKRLRQPRHEDITQLQYVDNTFDLVLHSEVLEHVPDHKKALSECRRVLKPGGICLFTVPIIPKRKTRICADVDQVNGEVRHLKQPSYHGSGFKNDYLVWWEFGADFVREEKLKIIYKDSRNLVYVFMIKKK